MGKLVFWVELAGLAGDLEDIVDDDGGAAGTEPEDTSQDEDEAGLHLRTEHVQSLEVSEVVTPPGLPEPSERRPRSRMPRIKGVGGPGRSHVVGDAEASGGLDRRRHDIVVGDRRVLGRNVALGRTFETHGGVEDGDVTVFHVIQERATGADAEERRHATPGKFLHRNGCRRSADSG